VKAIVDPFQTMIRYTYPFESAKIRAAKSEGVPVAKLCSTVVVKFVDPEASDLETNPTVEVPLFLTPAAQ